VVVLLTSLCFGMFTVFSIPIGSSHVSADDPPVTSTNNMAIGPILSTLGPILTSIVVTIPPITITPPTTTSTTSTTRPPLPTTTVAPTTTRVAPSTAPTTPTAPTSTQVTPIVTTIGSPTATTTVQVTTAFDGSVQPTTTTITRRFPPQGSTNTVGVGEIVPGVAVVTAPTTTSSVPTIAFGFSLNTNVLQQYQAATTTPVARVGLAHSNAIAPKEAKSSDVNEQALLFVIIGVLIAGVLVFIVLGEHHLRNHRALSGAKR
jgi:hypothetical protein